MAQFRTALDMAGDDPVLMLEDDILLCPDFERRAEAAIREHPGHMIQFFSRSRKDPEAGSRWRPGSTFSMNQCHYLPAGEARALLDYLPQWRRASMTTAAYDWLIADYLSDRRERYWLHVPSLVDHRVGPSAIDKRRAHDRRSTTFRFTDWSQTP